MPVLRKVLLRCLALCLALSLVCFVGRKDIVFAAGLSSTTDTLSTDTAQATNVTHTFSFSVDSLQTVKQVNIQFSTESSGTTKPAHLSLSSATLGTSTIFGSSDWSISTAYASSGLVIINRTTAASVSGGTSTSIAINGITNSAINDCEPLSGTLSDTCHITITTFQDDGSTANANGATTYTVTEDPSLSFAISGVTAGQTVNGITTDIATTGTTLPFGHMAVGTPKFASHKLTIVTNAPHGYTIYASLQDNMSGTYADATISPFGALNATWTTPQSWSSPDGSSANDNTGWFGANTTDTRVTGWSGNTQGKFCPISTSPHIVAQSSGPDRSGTDVYVTYGLEVNGAQPSDNYTGLVIYNVQASY